MSTFDIFNNNAQQNAANAQTTSIARGLNDLTGSYGQGRNALTTNYTAGLQPFLQNYGTATQGVGALGNALGLNGPQGNAAATAAFQNNPGYNFQLQQGENAALANAARTGQLASGNTDIALNNYAQGVANQGWNQYIQNLQPYLGASNAAATGIGGLYSGLGNALNQNYSNLGNAQYGAATSIGNAQANADLGALTGSANTLGFGAGALGLGANNAGSNSTNNNQPSVASSLFNAFLASDERVKDDIEKIGELYDGQNVYLYRYKGDRTPRVGLMAQEVERRYPEAVAEFGGIKHVDYGAATRYASRLHDFLKAA
jgi:hypothetical protein